MNKIQKILTVMVCVVMFTTVLAVAAYASESFDDQFTSPPLGPAWVISPGKGSYSLTDNPGYLRYIIDAFGWGGGAVPLQLIRPFSGDRWVLTTAITYNMRPAEPTNNRNMHFCIRTPGATGTTLIYALRSAGVNDSNPYSNSMVLFVGNNYTPIILPNSSNPLPPDRWYFEIERNEDQVAVRASNDGDDSTFEYQCENTYTPSVLGNDQEVLIQATGWYGSNDPPGYADFDFIKANFAGDTVVTGDYVAAEIVVTAPGDLDFDMFLPGENVNVISGDGSITVTNNSQSPSGWTVTAIDNASYGYMRVGGAGGSPYLATKLRIALDNHAWQWADDGDSWASGPASGSFDFWARQDVDNSETPGDYSIVITFTGGLNF